MNQQNKMKNLLEGPISSYDKNQQAPIPSHIITLDEVDVILKEQERIIKQIESEKNELLNKLGICEEDLTQFLADKSNFTHEAWEVIQEERRRINKKSEKEYASNSTEGTGRKNKQEDLNRTSQSHRNRWIVVR